MNVKKQEARVFIDIADTENIPFHVNHGLSHSAQRGGRVYIPQNIDAAVGPPVPVAVTVGNRSVFVEDCITVALNVAQGFDTLSAGIYPCAVRHLQQDIVVIRRLGDHLRQRVADICQRCG